MADIHDTAILTGDVQLADDVVVGPGCIFDGTVGPVVVGGGCRFVARTYVTGPTTIGTGNTIWPGASLGTPPQDVNYDPFKAGSGLIIGNDNVFRECATVHRGKTEAPTRIGDGNYFMTSAHVGHDSQVGNGVVMATGAMLGGHTIIEDKVILGGASTIHQFVRISRGCMVAGLSGSTCDVPPWCMVTSVNRITTQNVVGLRRSELSEDEVKSHRDVFKIMYRSSKTVPDIKATLQAMADEGDGVAGEYVAFFNASTRPLCPGPNRSGPRRSGR